MRTQLAQLALHLEQMGLAKAIAVECLYVPAYSPKLNLAEYVIHLLRLRFASVGEKLTSLEWNVKENCQV